MGFNSAKLTDAQFSKFSALIYAKCGIHLKPEKKELLNARLGKRLRATGIDSFKVYYEYVTHDTSGAELVQLIDSVSTNFTSFFVRTLILITSLPPCFPPTLQKTEGLGRGLLSGLPPVRRGRSHTPWPW